MNTYIGSDTCRGSLRIVLAWLLSGVAGISAGADVGYQSRYIPYALTLSGGISLGAYEAGVNWAVLRYLRISADRNVKSETAVMPELAAVTGASAGAINALISALAWCIDPEKVKRIDPSIRPPALYDGVSTNLFFQTWVPVGLRELLPQTEKAYAPREGVLTRSAFADVLSKITQLIGVQKEQIERYALPIPDVERAGMPIFRDGCTVPFGFTVTSEEPYQQQVSGLSVRNQRHFIPLRLKVQEGRVVYYNESIDPTAPGVGNVIYLRRARHSNDDPSSNHYEVDKGSVLNAVLTSSAFPVAFGRRTLEFCRPRTSSQNHDTSCSPETRPETGVFVDGGVFDNVPLGATKVLAEGGDVEPARRVTYVYIDPDQRRTQEKIVTAERTEVQRDQGNQKGRPKDAVMGFGLNSQLRFGRGSIDSARNYELHKELATGDWTAAVSVKREEVVAALQYRRSLPSPDGKAKPPRLMCDAGENPVNDECRSLFEELKKALKGGRLEARGFFNMPEGVGRFRSAESCVTENAFRFMHRLQFCPIKNREWEKERKANLDRMGDLVVLLRKSERTTSIRLKALENGIKRAQADPLGDRQVFISSRFHPIVGEYLFGFGAFLDRSFREFDYYVGVYDAVHSIAEKICYLREEAAATPPCRLSDEIETVYKLLGAGDDKAGAYILSMMLKREHPGDDYKTIYPKAITDKRYETIIQSLLTDNCSGAQQNKCLLWNKTFESFIGALNARKGDLSEDQRKTLQDLVGPSGEVRDWWLEPLSRVTHRLQNLEYTEPNKKGFAKQIGWMAVLVDAKASEGSLIQMGVRNESGFAGEGWVNQTVWPSELGYLGGSHGVPYVAWHWVTDFLSFQLPFEMHVKQYCGDACREGEPWITQVGARIQGSVKGVKLGFGMPEFNYLSRQNPDSGRRTGWGWSGFVGWQCLRATFGERSINGDLVTKPKDYYLDLGVRVEIFSSKKCP